MTIFENDRFPVSASMAIVLLLATACTTARVDAMKPSSYDLERSHPQSVVVGYEGFHLRSPESTDPNAARYWGRADATYVNAQAFIEAVRQSVAESNLFGQTLNEGDADYRLEVNILSEVQPRPGAQMSSTLVASWKLTRSADSGVVFDQVIEKTYKATPGSVVGVRTAVEGAVRENIREGIQRLSSLDL